MGLQPDHVLAQEGAIAAQGKKGFREVHSRLNGAPTPNLQAGGCRFGTDPRTSVLDADCRVHDVENLYVSDGSFMPTGGSVTFTFSIYANAFRVADRILATLPRPQAPPATPARLQHGPA